MDTMTSFWIPQLGGQKYAMTGMTMNWTLEASQTGTFSITLTSMVKDSHVKHLRRNTISQKDYDKSVKDLKVRKR